MKKVLFFASFVLAFAFANAASYELTYNGAPLRYGDTITVTANGDECEFIFSIWVTASGRTPTVYSTKRMNNSSTYITSICADDWCTSNNSSSPDFTPTAFPLDPGVEYINHFDFYVPEDAITALFKVTIYNQNNSSEKYEFYIKVKNPNVGIAQIANTSNLSFYPNPAVNMVNISLSENEQQSCVSICNMAGQQIRETIIPAGTTNTSISVADIPKGIYMITLNQNGRKESQKLVVK